MEMSRTRSNNSSFLHRNVSRRVYNISDSCVMKWQPVLFPSAVGFISFVLNNSESSLISAGNKHFTVKVRSHRFHFSAA